MFTAAYRMHLALDNIRQLLLHPAKASLKKIRKAASYFYYLPASFLSKMKLNTLEKPAFMNGSVHTVNEQAAEKAFSKQSAIFDELYSPNIIIQYKRQRVRDHVQQLLQPN